MIKSLLCGTPSDIYPSLLHDDTPMQIMSGFQMEYPLDVSAPLRLRYIQADIR